MKWLWYVVAAVLVVVVVFPAVRRMWATMEVNSAALQSPPQVRLSGPARETPLRLMTSTAARDVVLSSQAPA